MNIHESGKAPSECSICDSILPKGGPRWECSDTACKSIICLGCKPRGWSIVEHPTKFPHVWDAFACEDSPVQLAVKDKKRDDLPAGQATVSLRADGGTVAVSKEDNAKKGDEVTVLPTVPPVTEGKWYYEVTVHSLADKLSCCVGWTKASARTISRTPADEPGKHEWELRVSEDKIDEFKIFADGARNICTVCDSVKGPCTRAAAVGYCGVTGQKTRTEAYVTSHCQQCAKCDTKMNKQLPPVTKEWKDVKKKKPRGADGLFFLGQLDYGEIDHTCVDKSDNKCDKKCKCDGWTLNTHVPGAPFKRNSKQTELVLGCYVDVDAQLMTFSLNGRVLNDTVYLRRFQGFKDFIPQEHALLPLVKLSPGATASFCFDPATMKYPPAKLKLPVIGKKDSDGATSHHICSSSPVELEYMRQDCNSFKKGNALWLRSDWGDNAGISCIQEDEAMKVDQCPSPARMQAKIKFTKGEDVATSDVLADFVQKYCTVTGNHFQDYIVFNKPANPQDLAFQPAFKAYCESRREHGTLSDDSSAVAGNIPSPEQLASAAAVVTSARSGTGNTHVGDLVQHTFELTYTLERDVNNLDVQVNVEKPKKQKGQKTEPKLKIDANHYKNLVVVVTEGLDILNTCDADLPSLLLIVTDATVPKPDEMKIATVTDRAEISGNVNYRNCDIPFQNSVRLGIAEHLLSPEFSDWEVSDVRIMQYTHDDKKGRADGYEGEFAIPKKEMDKDKYGFLEQTTQFYEHLGDGSYTPSKITITCEVDIRIRNMESLVTSFQATNFFSCKVFNDDQTDPNGQNKWAVAPYKLVLAQDIKEKKVDAGTGEDENGLSGFKSMVDATLFGDVQDDDEEAEEEEEEATASRSTSSGKTIRCALG